MPAATPAITPNEFAVSSNKVGLFVAVAGLAVCVMVCAAALAGPRPGFRPLSPIAERDDVRTGTWSDASPHKSGFVEANGIKLHYLDWGGQGETLLFLAGLGDNAHIFDDLAPEFTDHFHVLAMTRRGFGEPDCPDAGYDLSSRQSSQHWKSPAWHGLSVTRALT
jgi:hypothetical protein